MTTLMVFIFFSRRTSCLIPRTLQYIFVRRTSHITRAGVLPVLVWSISPHRKRKINVIFHCFRPNDDAPAPHYKIRAARGADSFHALQGDCQSLREGGPGGAGYSSLGRRPQAAEEARAPTQR